jgi:hypothetical protein
MTLDQITRRILAAAEAQDLAALLSAAKERSAAMATLASMPPTPELRDAVSRSIAAGEEAKWAIRAIRQRIRRDSRRLANIETGFLRALAPVVTPRIDYRG